MVRIFSKEETDYQIVLDKVNSEWGRILGLHLLRAGKEKGVDFDKNIDDFILSCRKDMGIPTFIPHYGETDFGEQGIVLGRCFLGKGAIEGKWFKNVPKKYVEIIRKEKGDWRFILEERLKEGKIKKEQYEEAFKYGIYHPGFKLPRIPKR
jgi:hypothetical protein